MTTFETTKNRQLLIDSLKQKTMIIKFNKINGEFREMTCTLMETIVPPVSTTQKPRKSSTDILSVWDTNKEGWRSIRWENIIETTDNV